MGLSKLLAVGRSVRSFSEEPVRYKMTQQNLLPTFGGAKSGEARPEGDAATAPVAAPKDAPVSPAATAAAESVQTPSETGVAKADAFLEATKQLRPFGSWFKNPFARPEARPPVNQPVQTELSLDSVKPVRNDLSESEIELGRPARPAVTQPETPKTPTAAPALSAATPGLWQRLRARLFGASDTN